MNEELIDCWLNNEIDDQGKQHLEEWLREDPQRLLNLLDAVQLQEDLRALVGESPEGVMLTSQKPNGWRRIVNLSAVAAIIVTALFLFSRPSQMKATEDPLVWVISGHPRVKMTRVPPGPNPVPIAPEQWPVETQVTSPGEASSLRWDEGCVIEADAGTTLTLHREPDRDLANEPRSIRLDRGRLTVRLESLPVPVDTFVGTSQVRATEPAIFTVMDSGPQPIGREAVLSVIRGNVEILLPHATNRTVTAGEHVLLP